MKRTILWIAALALGLLLGLLGSAAVDGVMNFIATVFTRLFQLLSVPTIVLAVLTTLIRFGQDRQTGKIFVRTLTYTLLTTVTAAAVGVLLYVVISPDNLPAALLKNTSTSAATAPEASYSDHILSVIPDNLVRPFLEGNVLSLLLLAFAIGIGLSRLPESEGKTTLIRFFTGLQELLFLLVRGLIRILPLGIVAFSAVLAAQLGAGIALSSLGKYTAVIVGGNLIQFFIILPLFLLLRGLHPFRTMKLMSPALLMAFFTKSSAATLPVTMQTAEERLSVSKRVARFVLPICTTINMNGCAAFILVTSLFVMQNSGFPLAFPTILTWLLIAVVAAIGNAGVPMGCYFLTLSLMTGIGADVSIMGLVLPIYTIIDMVETAENVWSDSCVCAMTDHDLKNILTD